MKSLKISIDFDGSVVKHAYPNVGEDIRAGKVLRRLVDEGHKLILNTMRSGDQLQDAINWFEQQGLPLYGINRDPDQDSWTTSPKCFANMYIDDYGLGVPLAYDKDGNRYIDWQRVENLLEAMGVLPQYLSKDQLRREKELKEKNGSTSSKSQ